MPSKATGLKGFFGGQADSRVPQLWPQYSWLNLVLLDIEFRFQDTRFWPELLRQLSGQTVEQALKKTLSLTKINTFPAKQLVIYKYAQLLATMDTTHALFPIVCQKFFELYLWRVPVECDVRNIDQNMGVAEKFYEHNVTLMKTIKTQLKFAVVLCRQLSGVVCESIDLGSYTLQLLQEQSTSNKMVTAIGVDFFYHVVENMNDTTMKFPPTNDFYSEILEQLGVSI